MERVPTTMRSRGDLIDRMQQNNLFRGLPSGVYQFLADLSEVWSFMPTEVIVEHGKQSDTYYPIVEGEAIVSLKGGQQVATLQPADGFGEVGLASQYPQECIGNSKDIRQSTLCFTKSVYAMFLAFSEFGKLLSTLLAQRLSDTLTQVPKLGTDTEIPNAEIQKFVAFADGTKTSCITSFVEENHLTVGFVDEPQPEIVNRIQQFLPSMEIQVCSISSQFFNQVMQSISGLGDNEEESSSEEPSICHPNCGRYLAGWCLRALRTCTSSARHRPYWRIDGVMKSMNDVSKMGVNEVFELLKPMMREKSIEYFTLRNGGRLCD